jgi:hypothetical protein
MSSDVVMRVVDQSTFNTKGYRYIVMRIEAPVPALVGQNKCQSSKTVPARWQTNTEKQTCMQPVLQDPGDGVMRHSALVYQYARRQKCKGAVRGCYWQNVHFCECLRSQKIDTGTGTSWKHVSGKCCIQDNDSDKTLNVALQQILLHCKSST